MTEKWIPTILVCVALLFGGVKAASAAQMPTEQEYTNSLGMKFVRIEPGSFMMGRKSGGDFEEVVVPPTCLLAPGTMLENSAVLG